MPRTSTGLLVSALLVASTGELPSASAQEGQAAAPIYAAPIYAAPVYTAPAVDSDASQPAMQPSPYFAPPAANCGMVCGPTVEVVKSYRTTPRYGMLISGLSVFGALYLLTALPGTLITGDLKLAAPVVGPWLVAGGMNGNTDGVGMFWLAFDGLAQAAMLSLFIAGAVGKQSEPVYERMVLLPSLNAGGAGLTAVGRF
jgi:hypothetical protein